MKLKTYNNGLSLIEILISIVMIMLIIMAFAMVFPSGMRLNATNLRANKATEIANGVIEEIKNMPLCHPNSLTPCPEDFNSSGAVKSLECLNANDNWKKRGVAYWRPSSLPQDNFYQLNFVNDSTNLVFQSSQSIIGPGLAMPCDPLGNYEVAVTVTITWTDTKTNTPRNLTTRSLFNTNR